MASYHVPVNQLSSTHGPQATNQQNFASKTLTIIEDQRQKKIPTLILKLQKETPSTDSKFKSFFQRRHSKSGGSQDELEQYVNTTLENFKAELFGNINEFQQIVLSARPNPAMQTQDPTGYQFHAENYKRVLQLGTEIAKRMQESLNDILTQYEHYIEDLWTALCQKQDVRAVQRQFDQALQENMVRHWKPVFDSADTLIQDINRITGQQRIH